MEPNLNHDNRHASLKSRPNWQSVWN